MTRRSIKAWFLVHKWTSLICTIFMILLCLTGLPLIFHHEIDHALGYTAEPPPMAGAERDADVDEVVASALQRRPGDVVQFLVRDPDEPDAWFVRLGTTPASAAMSAFFTFDARTGEFLNDYPLEQGFMNLMLRLHVDMFAGLPGTLFLGFMGLLLVASLVSGAALYGPYMRKRQFGDVRRRRSRRIKWLDLHNLLGITTLVWFLVVGTTGVINTLSIPIFGQWQSTQLADMTADYRDRSRVGGTADLDRVVEAARTAEPDKEVSFIAFPANEFTSPRHFTAFMQGDTPLTSRLLKPVLIDARTAEVVDSRPLPWYVSMLLISQPLHFGDYGGMPLKILWALLDLITILVLGSGIYLWIRKGNRGYDSLPASRASGQPASPGQAAAARRDAPA